MPETAATPPSLDSDWAGRLAKQLGDLDCVYSTLLDVQRRNLQLTQDEQEKLGIGDAVDPCDLTHQTARSLSRVIVALGELPQFASGQGLTALTALRNAIMALDEGSHPTLLRPRENVSVGQDLIGRRIYKSHVVFCVKLLEALGQTNAGARIYVASVFGKAGHQGQREGKPLSAATLRTWERNLDKRGQSFVGGKLNDWRALPEWPPNLLNVEAYISRQASHPILSYALTK